MSPRPLASPLSVLLAARAAAVLISAAAAGAAWAQATPTAPLPAKQASVSPTAKEAAVAPAEKKAPVKQVKRAAKKEPLAPAVPEVEVVMLDADATQLLAAKEVLVGESGCEFGQKIEVGANPSHPGYIDLNYNKKTYTMKPVLSATGAVRLEDVRSETLMIQIASKTMVMNQKTGQRLIDNCVHPDQQTVTADTTQVLMK